MAAKATTIYRCFKMHIFPSVCFQTAVWARRIRALPRSTELYRALPSMVPVLADLVLFTRREPRRTPRGYLSIKWYWLGHPKSWHKDGYPRRDMFLWVVADVTILVKIRLIARHPQNRFPSERPEVQRGHRPKVHRLTDRQICAQSVEHECP